MKQRRSRTVSSSKRGAILEHLEQRCLMHADDAVFRIDAGGTSAYTDAAGNVWAADNGYSGGGGDQTNFGVNGTTDPKLYYTRRAGVFSYSKPVANGNYTLELLFADYKNPGQRKFNVTAEGKTILSDFDIAAAAGAHTALEKSLTVTVADGTLNLQFLNGSIGNPVVSGIALEAAEPTAPTAPSNLQASAGAPTSVNLNWTDAVTNNETGYEIQRSTDGGVNFFPVVTSPADQTTYADGGLTASTAYTYRLRAVNSQGASAWTNLANITTPAQQVQPPNAGVDIRVDAGNAGSYTDTSSNVWSPDANFTGGWFASTNFAVANTSDDPLYISRRAGDFTYSRAVPNGDYTLKLLFADYLTAGQRKFNVSAEGHSILTNYDIAADAGTRTAITKSFPVTVADGKIEVSFSSAVNYATVSAIELVASTAGGDVPTAPSNLTATPGANKISLAWKDNSTSEQAFEVWRSINNGPYMLAAKRGAGSTSYDDVGLDPANSYRYYVRATNAVGASAASNAVTATPLAGSPVDTWTRITWSTQASAPVGKSEALRAVVDGKLYVFAGFAGDAGPVTRSDVYDPATNTWKQIADMPTRLSHSGTAVVDRDVYFAGGYIGTGPAFTQTFGTKQVWKYNVDSNTYTAMPDLPVDCAGGGLVAIGRVLHFFGGDDINRNDTTVHFALDLDNLAAGWVTKAPMITPRSHMGYVNFDGKIYAIGGQKGNDAALVPQSAVEVYDPATDTWTSRTPMPKAINHISSATLVMGGRILTFGGQTTNGNAIADCYAYDPAADKWTTLSSLPAARFSGVAGLINGAIYFTTGSSLATTWKGVPG